MSLELLDLAYNSIESPQVLETIACHAPRLKYLDVSHNHLTKLALPHGWQQFKELRWLSLSSNALTSSAVAELAAAPRLETLVLERCGIEALPVVGASQGFLQLVFLSLAHNPIASLSAVDPIRHWAALEVTLLWETPVALRAKKQHMIELGNVYCELERSGRWVVLKLSEPDMTLFDNVAEPLLRHEGQQLSDEIWAERTQSVRFPALQPAPQESTSDNTFITSVSPPPLALASAAPKAHHATHGSLTSRCSSLPTIDEGSAEPSSRALTARQP